MRVEGKKKFRSANEYSVETDIVAHPSGGQASAIQLLKEINIITGVSSLGDSVKLPSAITGLKITIKNSSNSSINIYPYESNSIDYLSLNSNITLQPNKTITFFSNDNVNFESDRFNLSAEVQGSSLHNTLAGLQGGTTNEYYHLTQNQFNILVNGGLADSLHTHSSAGQVNVQHNDLSGLQGGILTQRYHLTSAEHSSLTGNVDASIRHNHNSLYYTENEIDVILLQKANISHVHNASDITAGTFNNTRISVGNVTQHEGSINHNNLLNTHNLTTDIIHSSITGAGSFSHSAIDNHINNLALHRQISSAETATNLWSGSKIRAEINFAEPTIYHNSLSSLQGGATNEYYHLTFDQESKLTSGGNATSYHIHDDRYYTEIEVNNLLNNKANISHTHNASDITTGIFNNSRISVGNVTQHEASINHNNLLNTHNLTTDIIHSSITGAGLFSHSAIDGHINNLSIHREISNAETATNLWSGSKIRAEINFAEPTIYHNSLSSLQGGAIGEYYHLTLAQQSKLTSGGNATTYHIHDDRYYTEAEVNNLLSNKANLLHVHNASDITAGTFNNARISVGNVTQHEGSINHNNLLNTHNLTTDIIHSSITGAGSFSHSAIDNHINSLALHRQISSAETATNLWSGSKIRAEINFSEPTIYHNSLSSLQGGATNEYYHLTFDQESKLTSGGNATSYHIHDDRYYTESEVNNLLSNKANISHTHNASDITAGTFNNARISAGNVTQHETSINHDNLLNVHQNVKIGASPQFNQISASSGTLVLKGAGSVAGNIELGENAVARIDADDTFFRSRDGAETFGLFNDTGLTLSSLSGGNGQIIIVNASGRLQLSGSSISDIQGGTNVHSSLNGLQGGTTNQYYHLTQSQHSILTTGGNADLLHSHLSGKAIAGTLNSWSLIGGDIYQQNFSHVFGTKDLFVETRNSATNDIVIPHKITFPDNNTVRVQVRDNSLSIRLVVSPSASGSGGGVSVHNDLDSLQGGTTNQYYHLTQDEESVLTSGGIADSYHIHSQPFIEQVINEQNGTTYTLLNSDHGKLVSLNNAASIILYVNDSLRTNFGCAFLQRGAGQITVSAIGNASVVNPDGFFTSEKRYVTCSLQRLSSSVTFLLDGRLV